jgi:hypothetical protein
MSGELAHDCHSHGTRTKDLPDRCTWRWPMIAIDQSETDVHNVAPSELDVWVRRVAALVVAAVAAYASYQHQRAFALHGGADAASAGLWPLSVDGLLLLATAALLRSGRDHSSRRVRLAGWLAFGLGIGVSLAANIASAPTLAWQPVLVAGWPPVALLFAVELLAHGPQRRGRVESETKRSESETEQTLVQPREESTAVQIPAAEDMMWKYFQRELARGHTPTGAELDRIAGTNNFGRAVLRRWRRTGRVPPTTVLRLGGRSNGTSPDDDDEELSS